MVKKRFSYIWQYTVKEEHIAVFKKIYGPGGDWVRLFRKADGYITTDLHQDTSNPNRFLTVDFWETQEDRDAFRHQFSEEFQSLDESCNRFTQQEEFLGDFDTTFLKRDIK